MQNITQTNSESRILSDAELDVVSGGNWFGDAVRFVIHAFKGDGDVRRSTDRPSDPVHH